MSGGRSRAGTSLTAETLRNGAKRRASLAGRVANPPQVDNLPHKGLERITLTEAWLFPSTGGRPPRMRYGCLPAARPEGAS